MNTRTNVKAVGWNLNHNETVSTELKVRTNFEHRASKLVDKPEITPTSAKEYDHEYRFNPV